MDFLQNHIEALIFCSPEPLSADELQTCLAEMLGTAVPPEDVVATLEGLTEKYADDRYSFGVYQLSGGYQFLTKPAYQASVGVLLKQKSRKRLSTAALETIAIIAYKQPITKSEVEQIRGVNCDYAIQKLLDKELICITGKAETAGRPLLYCTSPRFMEHFGIMSLRDLPQPKDFAAADNEIGQIAE